MYLLHPAGLVQYYFFYEEGIVKIRYRRIIKGNVAVLAYAQTYDVHRVRRQKRRVSPDFGGEIFCRCVE